MTLETYTAGPFSVRVWSAGAGRHLLYLHGWEQHPGDAAFLHALAAERRVIAPEHPGYGESNGIEDVTDIFDLVLYLRQFVESLKAGPVDVIGHCLGGMFAAELAAIAPQVVNRLILIDPFGLWLDDQPLPDPYIMSEKDLAKAKWHDATAAPAPEPALAPTEEPTAIDTMLGRARNLAASTKFLWPIPDRGLRRRAPYIQAPTLILHGASDGLIPVSYSEELATFIPGARVEVIAEAGHLPQLEQEAKTIAAIASFLDADR